MSILLFIAPRLNDGLRFCLRQARFVDPDRAIYLLTPDGGQVPEHILTIRPEELGLGAVPDSLPLSYLVAAMEAAARNAGATACWYLAEHTLLFHTLDWPEAHLADGDLAGAQAPDGQVLTLFARDHALASLHAALPAPEGLEEAADALDLIYEGLEEVRIGHTFCTGVQQTQGFRADASGQRKQIIWVHGQPFFVSTSSGLVARAITLHLPGRLAGKLHRYYTGPGMLLEKLKAEGRLLF